MTIIVAIVEGATRDMFDAASALGCSPWWKEYCQDRPWQALDCGPAPYEPSNLATAFTGTQRGEHGCFSYWHMTDPNGGRPGVLASSDVHRDWFWNWSELKGFRKAVVNVQLTHPVREIEGSLVSYLM
jgi:predicted AlkP superfamily phosphohydrolase/phosphomutase